jgi:hypothetical protein
MGRQNSAPAKDAGQTKSQAVTKSEQAGLNIEYAELGRISRSGEQDKKILRKWLATTIQHRHRWHAS